jgi:hypothetical protein
MTDPVISLGGKEFPVPLLAPRQQRIVIPAIMRLRTMNAAAITQEQYDDLCEISLSAAQRGTPSLKRDEFLDMPIQVNELLSALPVIAKQTGLLKESPNTGEPPKNSPTGTA